MIFAKECAVLVVTRSESERVRVGDVVVTLVKARNGKARIGIEAPRDQNIVREELVDGGFGPRKPRGRSSARAAQDSAGPCEP